MNLKQAEIILEKVNRLYKTMKLDERNIDVFEQDLMLSYIRQLYDVFAPEQVANTRIRPELPPRAVAPKPAPKPEPKPKPKPVPVPKVEVKKEAPPAPVVPELVRPPAPAPVPEPIPTPPPAPKPEPVKVEKPTPPPAPKPAPTPVPKPPAAPTPAPEKDPVGLSTAEQEELFDHDEATELSEKLSQLPIKNLTRAMGLNEKIFTINELFEGDSKAFDETIKTLNNFRTFGEARIYLSAYAAHRYKWLDNKRKKKARNFIKLIRRRYN